MACHGAMRSPSCERRLLQRFGSDRLAAPLVPRLVPRLVVLLRQLEHRRVVAHRRRLRPGNAGKVAHHLVEKVAEAQPRDPPHGVRLQVVRRWERGEGDGIRHRSRACSDRGSVDAAAAAAAIGRASAAAAAAAPAAATDKKLRAAAAAAAHARLNHGGGMIHLFRLLVACDERVNLRVESANFGKWATLAQPATLQPLRAGH
jgi:hypothetical protein